MHVIVGYHGLEDQCVTERVANMMCISITEDDVVHFPIELLCRPLVQRVNIIEWFFTCFSGTAILGSSLLSDEMRPPKMVLTSRGGHASLWLVRGLALALQT